LGIKLRNKEKRNALDLENGRDVEKRRSVFQKMGDLILNNGISWHRKKLAFDRKRCFCQFFETYPSVETLGRSSV